MIDSKSIHVLYVLTKLELGGAQKVCLTLLNGMRAHGITSSLISGTQGALVEQAKQHDSVFLLKSFTREVGIKNISREFVAFAQMIARMRKLKKQYPNIIVHTRSTKAGLMGRWAAFFARIKKRIHTVHGFGFHAHQSKLGWYINFILEYLTSFITTHYICDSYKDFKTGSRLLYNFSKKSSVIRAAIDWKKFCLPTIKNKKDFIFGTVSCMKPQKNLLDLLKAFKHMHDKLSSESQSRVRLQIIGDGIQKPLLTQWLTKNNFHEKVDLLTSPQVNVAQHMQLWSAFVMSSLWEGLPCAIVEARVSKLPVVSYKIAGIPEVITHNKNGFLVPAGNWKDLGKYMKLLIEDRNVHHALSFYHDNLDNFKNSVMIEKHVGVYRRV